MTGFFYELSKIVWAMVAPETLLVLLFAGGFLALLKGAKRTAAYLIGSGVSLMIAVGIFPLGNALLAPLEGEYRNDPVLRDVAAIIILGGGSNPDVAERWGNPEVNEAGDRYIIGAKLARRFPAARIYFTGGSGQLVGQGMSEAIIARDILRNAGVDPSRLILEGSSRSTAENARFLRQQVHAQSAGQWVLVTSAFHMPRAMLTFCKAGWKGLVPYPTDYRTSKFVDGIAWRFADHLAAINTGAKEWVGLAAYRLSGRASSSC